MEFGDCAFVKRSDGSWAFAYFQEISWRGENDRGLFGKEAVTTFTVDEHAMKERHIPGRRWLSSIRLWNTSKYRGAINMLDLDGSSSDHTRELSDRENSTGVNDEGSVNSLSDNDNGADCNEG